MEEPFINGFPKSGTHALQKACELLGVPARLDHRPFADGWPEGKTRQIYIKRDPRNVIISMLRFYRQPVTPGMIIAKFRRCQERSLVVELREHEGWLSAASTLVVSYEDLIDTDAPMRAIAEFCGVPYIAGAFEELPGLTATWNPVHSDWRTVWTADVERVWNCEGGSELLQRWGY